MLALTLTISTLHTLVTTDHDMIPAGSRRSKIRPPRKSIGNHDSKSDDSLTYESAWSVLSNAIVQIQNKNVSNLLYEQLYRKAYTLVLRKHGARLYDDVSLLIGNHLRSRREAVLKVYDQALTSNDEEFLQLTMREWSEHLQLMKFISDVLMYLNRVYVKENKRLLIYDLGVVLFDLHFVRYNNSDIGDKLVKIILHEITKSRKGQVITTKLYISQVIGMFETLLQEHIGLANSLPSEFCNSDQLLYLQLFEPAFLRSSESFFNNLADEYLASGQGSKYLQDVSRFVQGEEDRLKHFVSDSTYLKVILLMNNILIKDKIDRVMCYPMEQQGLLYWLEPIVTKTTSDQPGTGDIRDHTPELHILYDILGRVDPDRNLLKLRLRDAVVAQGTALPHMITKLLEQQASVSGNNKKVSSNASSSAFSTRWVDTVLEYQRHLVQLIKDAFDGDLSMEHTVFSAMRDFVNASGSTGSTKKKSSIIPATNAPELLSIFMDSNIKQLSKANSSNRLSTDANTSVDETEVFLHNAIAFLKFIKDKDAFEAHYAAHFAKRFLNSKVSASSSTGIGYGDLEELAIAKLSEELGSASLEKIIRMKKDVNQSSELTMEWKNHTENIDLKLVELELKICHVSDWPNLMTKDYKSFSNDDGNMGFIWPSQFRETMKTFEEFWLTGKKNDNKTLFWSPKFGLMDLRITYPSKTYEINLSTYAGIIMMLFAPQSTDARGNPVLAFDENRELTYQEIYELTKIPEQDLRRQLQSIAVAPRLRLLVKIPMTKEVNLDDKFRLNDKFKAPTNKVKVLTVSLSSSTPASKPEAGKVSVKQEESDEVKANIEEGRKHLVNAAIVRIMKSRQTVDHNLLIAEIIKQLQNHFQPLTLLIKQRIEDLIEKEYLERDSESPGIYHYVA